MKLEINLISGDLFGLMKRKECGQLTFTQEIELTEKKKRKIELDSDLLKKEKKGNELCDSTPATRKTIRLGVRSRSQRIEEDQSDLLKTICDIAV